jgi:hypothetical protein
MREWQAGCPEATAIIEAAAHRLAETVEAAAAVPGSAAPVALTGSLLLDRTFRALVVGEIAARLPAASVVDPAGSPLDGAALLCATSAGQAWFGALRFLPARP